MHGRRIQLSSEGAGGRGSYNRRTWQRSARIPNSRKAEKEMRKERRIDVYTDAGARRLEGRTRTYIRDTGCTCWRLLRGYVHGWECERERGTEEEEEKAT